MNEAIKYLKLCIELFERQESSSYILDLLSETVHYDEVDCDGSCLVEDIKMYLEEVEDNNLIFTLRTLELLTDEELYKLMYLIQTKILKGRKKDNE